MTLGFRSSQAWEEDKEKKKTKPQVVQMKSQKKQKKKGGKPQKKTKKPKKKLARSSTCRVKRGIKSPGLHAEKGTLSEQLVARTARDKTAQQSGRRFRTGAQRRLDLKKTEAA